MPHSKRGLAQLRGLLFQRLDTFSCLPMIVFVFGRSESPTNSNSTEFPPSSKCLPYASIIGAGSLRLDGYSNRKRSCKINVKDSGSASYSRYFALPRILSTSLSSTTAPPSEHLAFDRSSAHRLSTSISPFRNFSIDCKRSLARV
jgi:hypothetical protein